MRQTSIALVLLGTAAITFSVAGRASAAVPGGYTKPSAIGEAASRCAPRPTTYEGVDEQVAALTYLEQELADECVRKVAADTELLTTADNTENEVHSLLVEVKAWGSTGLPSFKAEQTVACSNCSGGGGGGGGEVELAAPSKAVVEQAPMSATAYLIGALVGFMFFGVIYLFLRSKT
jgi:hypothetical protein